MFDFAAGLKVVARRPDGEVVIAQMALDRAADTLQLRVGSVQRIAADGGYLDDATVPTIAEIEAKANEPGHLLNLLQAEHLEPGPDGLLPMRLPIPPPAQRGRLPDSFYERVASYAATLAEHGIAAGPRLAADNGVPESTVYRWLKEARRRKLLNEEAPR